MLNKSALLKRGWTPALIAAVLGQPDQVEEHKSGFKRWTEHLYLDVRVQGGESDPRFVEAAHRRRTRARAAERRRPEVPKKYTAWRDALPEAASGLFSLSRYAKHRTCSSVQRIEIYALKNDFIRMLYAHGYCTRAWIHRMEVPAQKCRECGGDGGGDWDCPHCGGSGIWREARTLEFWCFRFQIAGKTYCWHQPLESVDFGPEASLPPQDWEGMSGEKPVALPKRKFAIVKELLRWVTDAAWRVEDPQIARQEEDAVPFDFGGQPGPMKASFAAEQACLFPI